MIHVICRNGQLEILKREAVSRRRRWDIRVTYDTPLGEQVIHIKPDNKCRLPQLAKIVSDAIHEDIRLTGTVNNIAWEAKGR